MSNQSSAAVIVGVDYSPDSQTAIDVGAWEANRRSVPLRLVHAAPYPPAYSPGLTAAWDMDLLLEEANRLLERTAEQVAARYPTLRVSHVVVAGGPAAALLDQAHHASLLVLGNRGHGGFTGLLSGSVASQVVTHAHIPVLVVRAPDPQSHPGGPVVVGVDGSPASEAALAFAFAEADARGEPLVAVYAWDVPPTRNLGPITDWHYDSAEAQGEAERMLAEAIAGWAEKYPDVLVRQWAIHSLSAAACLRDASAGASLLVVGSRGRGGFTGLLLGSVSRTVLAHARCPVAVIHTTQ